MSRVLIELVRARAINNWAVPLSKDTDWKAFYVHWVKCARELADEMDAVSLPETAKAFRAVADEQEKSTW
jgi:hypothetical protein